MWLQIPLLNTRGAPASCPMQAGKQVCDVLCENNPVGIDIGVTVDGRGIVHVAAVVAALVGATQLRVCSSPTASLSLDRCQQLAKSLQLVDFVITLSRSELVVPNEILSGCAK